MLMVANSYQAIPQKPSTQENKGRNSLMQGSLLNPMQSQIQVFHINFLLFFPCVGSTFEYATIASLWTTTEPQIFLSGRCGMLSPIRCRFITAVMQVINIIPRFLYFLKLQTYKEKFPVFGIEFRSRKLPCLMECSKIWEVWRWSWADCSETNWTSPGGKKYVIKVKENPTFPPPWLGRHLTWHIV